MFKTLPSNAGAMGSIPGQGAKMPFRQKKKTNTQNRSNIVTNSIKTLKMVHIKKKILKKNRKAVPTIIIYVISPVSSLHGK